MPRDTCKLQATYLSPPWSQILSQQSESPTELGTPKPYFHGMINMSLTGNTSDFQQPLQASLLSQLKIFLLQHHKHLQLRNCSSRYLKSWIGMNWKLRWESAVTSADSHTSRSWSWANSRTQTLRTPLLLPAPGAMMVPTVEILPPAHPCSWQMAPRTVQSLKCGEVGQYLTSGGNFFSLAPIIRIL